MSYHILHLLTPGAILSCDQGFLFCRYTNGQTNKIPIIDLRALIIATHQISFSNDCLARLLETDLVILHCNTHYQPVGWSSGLTRVVHTQSFFNQIAQYTNFEQSLWEQILQSKIHNQTSSLALLGADNTELLRLGTQNPLNEGLVAKKYWRIYFQTLRLRNSMRREHQHAKSFENIALNYGYAVISTLLYRAVLIHGLLPQLGIHHKAKHGSTPLIYDLLEPFRAFVDFYLYKFCQEHKYAYIQHDLRAWSKYLAACLQDYRLPARGLSYKLLDFMDVYVTTIAQCFLELKIVNLNLPDITVQSLTTVNSKVY